MSIAAIPPSFFSAPRQWPGIGQPFHAEGNIATAGGCLASQYLATWILLRGASRDDAEAALHYVAPVRQKAAYVSRAMRSVEAYLPNRAPAAGPVEETLPS